MEVTRLNTGTLKATEYNYTFHDVSIVFDNDKQIIVEGNVEMDFDFEQSGLFEEDKIEYNIDTCDVNIKQVWNDESEEINLTPEEMQLVQNEIELMLRSETVEKN